MKEYEAVYEVSKKLDDMFDDLYDNHAKDTIEKNIMALLVELGELANETRCFKYWSIKPSSSKEVVIEEYVDCLFMALYFSNMVNLELDEDFEAINQKDIIAQFKYIYHLSSQLTYQLDRDLVKKIFINIINLGKLLNLTTKDIIDGCFLKAEKIKQRFKMDY